MNQEYLKSLLTYEDSLSKAFEAKLKEYPEPIYIIGSSDTIRKYITMVQIFGANVHPIRNRESTYGITNKEIIILYDAYMLKDYDDIIKELKLHGCTFVNKDW